MDENNNIEVFGAREHNLKNIDVSIPRNKLTVITGLSGSGKSSLAFDTIHAEGQRRYIETLSSYARQFIGSIERPDVDKITGLSPVIAIEQKTTNRNPRSTVGTITEIYDFLRLFYARASDAYSYASGEKMIKYTEEQTLDLIINTFNSKNILILAPVVKGRKGHYKELFEQIRKKGFLNVRIDGKMTEISFGLKTDRYKNHTIEIVIDKLQVHKDNLKRIKESVRTAMIHGKGIIMVMEKDTDNARYYSRSLMCPVTGISYNEPAPHTFSFNSPKGYCPKCKGLGEINEIDQKKIIPISSKSIANGGIEPLGMQRNILIFWQIESILKKHHLTLNTPIKDIPEEILNIILFGSDEMYRLENSPLGENANYFLSFDGVISYLNKLETDIHNAKSDENSFYKYIKVITCPECKGQRLNKEALHFKIDGKNIAEQSSLDIRELANWFENIEERLSSKQRQIASELLKEIRMRIRFLLDVGLDYLSLNRTAGSLSGGESQRIRLATQIGTQLVNVLYILDEPSIGLHQRDNLKLIHSLKQLRDAGNTVIVVEHDKDMIMAADYVIDIGPLAGRHGGKIIAQGIPEEIKKSNSLTAMYLNNKKQIVVPKNRRQGNGKFLVIKGASGNNLKNITVKFPLGKLICVTGVSGSGKSTLINETLYPIINKKIYHSIQEPLEYKSIEGLEHLDKVIEVDQTPLGRTPRSNPATYTGVFTDIRSLFEHIPEAQIRGFKASRFSFNVKGGRCEECKGAGVQTIEMNFLPDVYVTCKACNGKRYNKETLDVKFKGKSISDVLDLTIDQAVEFFENIPSIYRRIKTLQDVGLGYITLGQPSTTLSGGESQRVKLAAELTKKDTGRTLYILDEPTTGLHFEDVNVLLGVLNRLMDKGNTIIVIEHNLDVIKVADYIIDLGMEGGKKGGQLIACGSPEEILTVKESYTTQSLIDVL